jgi:hypothetical protein
MQTPSLLTLIIKSTSCVFGFLRLALGGLGGDGTGDDRGMCFFLPLSGDDADDEDALLPPPSLSESWLLSGTRFGETDSSGSGGK